MDLLTAAGVVGPPRAPALRLGMGLSALVHAVMAALLLTMPVRQFPVDAPIEIAVDVVTDLVAPPPALVPATPWPSPLSTPTHAEIPRGPRVREARRAPRPPTPDGASPAPDDARPDTVSPDKVASPVAVEADGRGPPAASPSAREAASTDGARGAATSGAGTLVGTAQHRGMVDRYRIDVLGTRIRQVFRYPVEAQELELAGRVLLNVSIGGDGRLLSVRLAGRCPHPILCADGLRTIRAAAPFPPIPAELGPSITVEVPLTYAFAVD